MALRSLSAALDKQDCEQTGQTELETTEHPSAPGSGCALGLHGAIHAGPGGSVAALCTAN